MLYFLNSDENFAEIVQFIEDGIPMGLFSMDIKTRAMRWSPGMFRLLGLNPETYKPTAAMFETIVHPSDRAALATVELAMHNAMPLHIDLQTISSIGRPRWVRVNAEFLQDAQGKPNKMIGSLLNVSAEHEARLRAQAIDRRLAAVRSVCSPIWLYAGPDGRVERIDGWQDLTGQAPGDSRDSGWMQAIHPADIDRVTFSWDRAIDAEQSYAIEMRIRGKDGDFRWMIARGTPVRDESGAITEWIGTLADIHAHKEWPPPLGKGGRLSGAQIRGARAIVNWSVKHLSEATGVPVSSIRRIEEFDGVITSSSVPIDKIKHALEQAGVDFVSPPIGKPAVRPA